MEHDGRHLEQLLLSVDASDSTFGSKYSEAGQRR